jgi:hypothetical protein
MKPILFIDDDEMERRSSIDVLREIFAGTSIVVEPSAPLATLNDYSVLIANKQVAGLIIDEHLNTAGGVNYSGVELAAHLRAIGGMLPIVVLTNYPDDDFAQRGWAVENIFAKNKVIFDPNSPEALAFKARLSRLVEMSGIVMAERERRYHELLVKFARTNLSDAEKTELDALEADRIAPVSAVEREKQQRLDKEIENLKRLLG